MVELTVNVATIADKLRWDEYVDNHPDSTPYHRFAWQEAVQSAYGHSMAGVIATNSVNKQVCGVFPAIRMSVPLGGRRLCALPYCDTGFGLAEDSEILHAMQQQLLRQMRERNDRFLEVRGLEENFDSLSSLVGEKVRMVLPLPGSSEALFGTFKSKLRSQIRKAEKNGLTVQLGNSAQFIDWFYAVYSRNMRDLGSPVHAKAWFTEISRGYADNAIISVVFKDDVPIGAGIVLKTSRQACIPWASTLRNYNRLAPNMLLYWSLLSHCAEYGFQSFDFGRSTYDEGTYRFKKQWGAKAEALRWRQYDRDGEPIPQQYGQSSRSTLRQTSETLWRKLPLNVTVKVGSLIRPYISL